MRRKMLGGLLCLLVPGILTAAIARQTGKISADQEARKSLDAFNEEWIGTCQKMDNAAAAALWAEDGADLIQGMAPMIGKSKISAWLNSLTPQLAGAKMVYCTVDWQKIQMQGDFAYEWGINKQKIEFPPPQKPFEGAGKILLIVKRQADGAWKIEVESWNSLPQAEEKP